MTYFFSPKFYRHILLVGIVILQRTWRRLVNELVPEPYLDEVFHIPQAQAYWAGKWLHWDPKITTPPGLYVFSHYVNLLQSQIFQNFDQSTENLRFVNALLWHLLPFTLGVWNTFGKKPVNRHSILQREDSIVMFPLLFFFSGLYYTDLFSIYSVLLTYISWSANTSSHGVRRFLFQVLHLLFGLVALASRQTNIFWVAIFLGALQVLETVKSQIGAEKIHDPPISEAYFEDFPITSISIAQFALGMLPRLVLDLWPQLVLLASFGTFVMWNGGVVLGDKNNHIATIHLPQMLYIWPFLVFFSWPAILPSLANFRSLGKKLPRFTSSFSFSIAMAAIVHMNTIVHPFTLADNRHYVFYVFRILLKHWTIKYAAVPVYFACSWLAIIALGGRSTSSTTSSEVVRVSFVLVWLGSTALSLITAPLVEPRYFMVPWLIWRMHIPVVTSDQTSTKDQRDENKKPSSMIESLLQLLATYSVWIECTWYILINAATCWMFLYRGFSWQQEPGKIQRFMW